MVTLVHLVLKVRKVQEGLLVAQVMQDRWVLRESRAKLVNLDKRELKVYLDLRVIME